MSVALWLHRHLSQHKIQIDLYTHMGFWWAAWPKRLRRHTIDLVLDSMIANRRERRKSESVIEKKREERTCQLLSWSLRTDHSDTTQHGFKIKTKSACKIEATNNSNNRSFHPCFSVPFTLKTHWREIDKSTTTERSTTTTTTATTNGQRLQIYNIHVIVHRVRPSSSERLCVHGDNKWGALNTLFFCQFSECEKKKHLLLSFLCYFSSVNVRIKTRKKQRSFYRIGSFKSRYCLPMFACV